MGCSGYRIDLAVVDPTASGRYLLGIECDGANYHRARTARARSRPAARGHASRSRLAIASRLVQEPFRARLKTFLDQYEVFVLQAVHPWAYAAETVAENMQILFDQPISVSHRAQALEIAIKTAIRANRFAALDRCRALIAGVREDDLGLAVAELINQYRGTYVADIDPSWCRSPHIHNALHGLRTPWFLPDATPASIAISTPSWAASSNCGMD